MLKQLLDMAVRLYIVRELPMWSPIFKLVGAGGLENT